jgi:hypothetical protein
MKRTKSILVILLFASCIITRSQAQKYPPPPPPKANMEKIHQPKDLTAFLEKNQTIGDVHWQRGNKIILTLKNENTETYDLSKKVEKRTFIKKYGKPPTAPPPPPPARTQSFSSSNKK